MNSVISTFNNIANTVMEAVNPAPSTLSDLTRRQVIRLEENERNLRLAHPAAASISRKNAAQVSAIISATPFPFTGLISRLQALKLSTVRLEERERERRVTSSVEAALRKSNGNRTAGMIQALGWPFYNRGSTKGPFYTFVDPTALAEEEERQYRINNPLQAQMSKSNAAFVANAIRWGLPNRSSMLQSGSKKHTRSLQEKERTRLLNDQEGIYSSVQNAYNQAGLIRHLGWPFFVQSKNIQTSGQDIAAIEQSEQQRRISDLAEQNLARSHAQMVSRLIPRADIALPTAARSIPQQAREQPVSIKKISQSSPAWSELFFVEPANDINAAVESERNRRIRQGFEEAIARQGAARIANIIRCARPAHPVDATPSPSRSRRNARRQSRAPGVGDELSPFEEERLARMHDWSAQQNQMRNGRYISRLLSEAGFPKAQPFVQRSEERERYRRMVDLPQKEMDMQNARQMSNMIMNHFNRPTMNQFRAAPSFVSAPSVAYVPTIAPGAAFTNAALARNPSFIRNGGRPILSRTASSPALPSSLPYIPAGTNTFYSASGSHNLSAPQLRRLQRQAMKENKIANKQSRKANSGLLKSQKLAQKGKSTSKVDTQTQKHLAAAKEHHAIANDLLAKQMISPATRTFAPIGLAAM